MRMILALLPGRSPVDHGPVFAAFVEGLARVLLRTGRRTRIRVVGR